VFTLDPGEVFARETRRPRLKGVPAVLAETTEWLIVAVSTIDTLLDPDPAPDEGGRDAVAKWSSGCADFASRMRDDGISPDRARQWVHAFVLNDLMFEPDVQQLLGPDLDRSKAWIDGAYAEVGRMPCLGRTRALLYSRMRNNASWSHNDFTDIHYLACAAGYADVVVGEKRTIGDLATATGGASGATLATTLTEALAAL
jgi:hypothetical protein